MGGRHFQDFSLSEGSAAKWRINSQHVGAGDVGTLLDAGWWMAPRLKKSQGGAPGLERVLDPSSWVCGGQDTSQPCCWKGQEEVSFLVTVHCYNTFPRLLDSLRLPTSHLHRSSYLWNERQCSFPVPPIYLLIIMILLHWSFARDIGGVYGIYKFHNTTHTYVHIYRHT